MKSENYRVLLNNEFKKPELTPEEFDNTLMHFVDLKKEELKEKLEELHTEYFNKYTNIPEATSDYFLFLGKCAGIDEALNVLEENEAINKH